jgi:hypothetical protein
MPRPVNERPIRAFPVDKVLEHIGQQAGKSHAEHHAIGFVANLLPMWPKMSIEPEQAHQPQ